MAVRTGTTGKARHGHTSDPRTTRPSSRASSAHRVADITPLLDGESVRVGGGMESIYDSAGAQHRGPKDREVSGGHRAL